MYSYIYIYTVYVYTVTIYDYVCRFNDAHHRTSMYFLSLSYLHCYELMDSPRNAWRSQHSRRPLWYARRQIQAPRGTGFVLAVTPTAIGCVWVSNIRKSCQNVLVRYEVSLRERISTTSIIQIYIHFRATLPIPGDSMHCTRGLEGTHRISRWGVDVDVLVHGLPVRFLIWPAQREDLSNSYPAWDILGTDWPHEFGNGRNHGNWWSTMRFISRQDFDMLLGRIISFLLQPIHWAQNNLQQFFIITKLNWSHAPRLENGTEFLRPSDGGPQLYPTCQFCFTASRITSLSAINSGLRYDIPWPYRSNESACESACHLLRLKWGYPQIIPNYIDIYKPF